MLGSTTADAPTTTAQLSKHKILVAILTKVTALHPRAHKVNGHEEKPTFIEQRISAMFAHSESVQSAVSTRFNQLQQDVQRRREATESQVQELRRRLRDHGMASTSSSAPTASAAGLPGFPRASPLEAVAVGTRDMVGGGWFSLQRYAPVLLGSVGHADGPPEADLRIVPGLRERPSNMQYISAEITVRAAIERPRDLHLSNRVFIRMSDKAQECHKDLNHKSEAWKTICWRSSTVVLMGRRVATVKDLRVSFVPGWYFADIFFSTAEGSDRAVHTATAE